MSMIGTPKAKGYYIYESWFQSSYILVSGSVLLSAYVQFQISPSVFNLVYYSVHMLLVTVISPS